MTGVSQGHKLTIVVTARRSRDQTLTLVPIDGHDVRIDGLPVVSSSTKDAGLIGVELGYPLRDASPRFRLLGDPSRRSVR